MAEAQLRHILKNEIAHLNKKEQLTINAVEENIEGYLLLEGVNIKGKIDRVDTLDGCLRIIDYKTGKLEKNEITYQSKELEQEENEQRQEEVEQQQDDKPMPGKWLQLMWYALLYRRTHSGSGTLKAGIYPLRNLRSDVKLVTWNGKEEIGDKQLKRFEELLKRKAGELMDPTIAFLPTPSTKACAHCPAKNYCNNAVK